MIQFTKEELNSIVTDYNLLGDSGTTFVILDENLQVLYVNYNATDDSQKLAPGDLLRCSNALEAEGGCGTHENCQMCKFRNMVEDSIQKNMKEETDAELLINDNQNYYVHAVSTPFVHDKKKYTVVLLVDRTDHQNDLMMQRIFFHDILNLSGALNGILDCMGNESSEEMVKIVKNISSQLMNEILAQRDLIYAKNGILTPQPHEFKASEMIDFVKESLVHVALDMWAVTLKIESTLTDEILHTDRGLVSRVINNMVKNAGEASPGTTVTFKAVRIGDKIRFSVHNDAVMSADMKSKVFIYGNSTKGSGRGLGTYSMKLIGENYLHGHVWFRSEEGEGTDFFFELPVAAE